MEREARQKAERTVDAHSATFPQVMQRFASDLPTLVKDIVVFDGAQMTQKEANVH